MTDGRANAAGAGHPETSPGKGVAAGAGPVVQVWWHDGPSRPEWVEVLEAAERERYDAMTHRGTREAFLAAHWLLRQALSVVVPDVSPRSWRFAEGRHGKPELSPDGPVVDGLEFNLAHTAGSVVAAVSLSGPVGVDCEDTRRVVDVDRLIHRYFSERERAWLGRLDAAARRSGFFDAWVLKEATIKMRGGALGSAITATEITPEAIRDALDGPGVSGRWLRRLDDHVFAVAAGVPAAELQLRRWAAEPA